MSGSRSSALPDQARPTRPRDVERLLESGARVAIVDPLGVWWGLRASADGSAAGYPVVVFGGKHADVPITGDTGAALGGLIAREAFVCVVDLSELGSNAARRRFMAAFSEALYEANEERLHLLLDEADLWAPQRPIKGWEGLLGHIEEIVRRGRVRGFIPWVITQRPAVVDKDVLSQADILIAMKLTASQDRDAIGAWLSRNPHFRQLATPRTLAKVDLTAIMAALAAVEDEDLAKAKSGRRRDVELEHEVAAAKARIEILERENRELNSRLTGIAALAAGAASAAIEVASLEKPRRKSEPTAVQPRRFGTSRSAPVSGDGFHSATRKLLVALAQHALGRFTWGQAATLAGLKPSGGHFNAGRKDLRAAGFVGETKGLVTPTPEGLKAAGEVPPAPSTPAERLAMWCDRPSVAGA
jgi:uncharacterized protein